MNLKGNKVKTAKSKKLFFLMLKYGVNINLFLFLVKVALAKDLLLPHKKGTSIIPQKEGIKI